MLFDPDCLSARTLIHRYRLSPGKSVAQGRARIAHITEYIFSARKITGKCEKYRKVPATKIPYLFFSIFPFIFFLFSFVARTRPSIRKALFRSSYAPRSFRSAAVISFGSKIFKNVALVDDKGKQRDYQKKKKGPIDVGENVERLDPIEF